MSTTTTTPPAKGNRIPLEDAWKHPQEFLLSRGWKPQGDPYQPGTDWLDPTKPTRDTEERVLAHVIERPNGAREEVYQTLIRPRGWPISLQEAMITAVEREKAQAQASAKK